MLTNNVNSETDIVNQGNKNKFPKQGVEIKNKELFYLKLGNY